MEDDLRAELESMRAHNAQMQKKMDEMQARLMAQSRPTTSQSVEHQVPNSRGQFEQSPASRGYDCGYTYESYREPPQSYWSNAYQPYSCSQPQSWSYHDKGTYAPDPYFQQRQHQAQRATPPPPPQQAPRLKSMTELYKEYYGYDYVPPTEEERMQRRDKIFQNHSYYHSVPTRSYSDVEAYVPAPPPPQQYQVPRVEPPQQEPSVLALFTKLQEKADKVVAERGELKAKVEARGIALQDLNLQMKQVEAIVIQSGNASTDVTSSHGAEATDPPSPSHERAEAIEATEEEPIEEIPVPTVYPPPTEMSGRSEEEQCHEHVPVPSYVESTQGYHEDTCSMSESDKLIKHVVHEIELLCGEKKAQVCGVRQERKAATHKKPRGSKSGPRGRYKDRHSMMKGAMAASRKMKPSTPRNTTKVKMKAKRGVGKNKGPRQEGKKTGRCVPKMEYLKFIGGKHLFPPPFIP